MLKLKFDSVYIEFKRYTSTCLKKIKAVGVDLSQYYFNNTLPISVNFCILKENYVFSKFQKKILLKVKTFLELFWLIYDKFFISLITIVILFIWANCCILYLSSCAALKIYSDFFIVREKVLKLLNYFDNENINMIYIINNVTWDFLLAVIFIVFIFFLLYKQHYFTIIFYLKYNIKAKFFMVFVSVSFFYAYLFSCSFCYNESFDVFFTLEFMLKIKRLLPDEYDLIPLEFYTPSQRDAFIADFDAGKDPFIYCSKKLEISNIEEEATKLPDIFIVDPNVFIIKHPGSWEFWRFKEFDFSNATSFNKKILADLEGIVKVNIPVNANAKIQNIHKDFSSSFMKDLMYIIGNGKEVFYQNDLSAIETEKDRVFQYLYAREYGSEHHLSILWNQLYITAQDLQNNLVVSGGFQALSESKEISDSEVTHQNVGVSNNSTITPTKNALTTKATTGLHTVDQQAEAKEALPLNNNIVSNAVDVPVVNVTNTKESNFAQLEKLLAGWEDNNDSNWLYSRQTKVKVNGTLYTYEVPYVKRDFNHENMARLISKNKLAARIDHSKYPFSRPLGHDLTYQPKSGQNFWMWKDKPTVYGNFYPGKPTWYGTYYNNISNSFFSVYESIKKFF